MSGEHRRTPLAVRVVLIGAGTVAMVALAVGLGRASAHHDVGRRADPPRADSSLAFVGLPDGPIVSEADVFRTVPSMLAVAPRVARRPAAHPRTLATFRAIRAYPGAPPRIPHGLTADEYRTGRCTTCHLRGGYAQRFASYAPVTPHPELQPCLSCHVPDAAVVGVALPGANPDDVCRQCHAPPAARAAARAAAAAIDWRPMAWPTLSVAVPNDPPPIPHDDRMRANCVTCHGGAAAVAEIRTDHAERADCRACHVQAQASDAGGAP